MKGRTIALRPNIQIIWLAEHDVIIACSREKALHVWLHCEDKTVMPANILRSTAFFRHLIEQSPKNVLIHISYQDQACIIAVRVHICSGVQLTYIIAVF